MCSGTYSCCTVCAVVHTAVVQYVQWYVQLLYGMHSGMYSCCTVCAVVCTAVVQYAQWYVQLLYSHLSAHVP